MTAWLRREGHPVNRKRIQRLMRSMGLGAIYPKPKLSQSDKEHRVCPYLLRGICISRPDQVRSADITYIPMQGGFMYLTAIMDWYSRYVISRRLSNTMDANFCPEALQEALSVSKPEIFNTDQGAQFTSRTFTECLTCLQIRVSMDGRGRASDNVFVERLWRSLKYEEVYRKDYRNGKEAFSGVDRYFRLYNRERPHQALGDATPYEVWSGKVVIPVLSPKNRL